MRATTSSLVSASLLLGQAAGALQPIIAKGNKFFYANGTQFFIKGVAYQQDSAAAGQSTNSTTYHDPLADTASCKRDVPLLKALGTNTIRTYAVDPTKNHDECMKLLDDAGIYVISDLAEPALAITTDNTQWNVDLFKRYTDVIDNLSQYSNVIGFFAGNEVTTNKTNTASSAYVKAAVRDTKAYIKKNVKRWVGVGYAANDDPDVRGDIAHFFNCGNQAEAIDFWGYNIYEWCGDKTIETSGYQTQIDFFKNYSIPVFFAEYGCNTQGGADGRLFEETTALYSDAMSPVFAGGIVYMYFEETNDYGLVKVDGDSASTMKNYDTLKSRVAAANPSSTSANAFTPTNSPASCPPVSDNWKVKGEALPPTPDASLCGCMASSVSCGPADNLDSKNYGAIFDFICGSKDGKKLCAGINGDTVSGVYGAYAGCAAKDKLGYVLDQYYQSQNKAAGACDFKGQAVLKSPSAASSCTSALASASSANANAATATSGNGASGPAAASSSSAAVGTGPVRSLFALGDLMIGLYVVVAMGVGASMVML